MKDSKTGSVGRLSWLLLVCGISLLAREAPAELKVAATVTDLGDIASRIGGEDAEVFVLCPGDQDPHYLPAKPSLARKLGKAHLIIYNGLELEIGWLPLLVDAARNPRIRPGSPGELDCSLALETILEVPAGSVDRSQGDVHPLGNPHYLADPRNGAAVALLLAERMAELEPAHAEAYRQRARDYAAELEELSDAWLQCLMPVQERPIVIYKKEWEYLAAWADLNIIGAIEHRPGIAPSPRHVEGVVELGRSMGQVIVIAAPWDHLDAARKAADRMDAPLLVLPAAVGAVSGVDSYEGKFEKICDMFEEVLMITGR